MHIYIYVFIFTFVYNTYSHIIVKKFPFKHDLSIM